MSEREPKRRPGIGRVVLAALCAVSLALTVLSGCRVYVTSSGALNPFLGEWHAEYTWDGISYETEYKFDSNGKYSYSNIRQSTSGMVGDEVKTEGSYEYDSETLSLTPVPGDLAFPEIEYEFIGDDMLELRERVTTSRTRVVVYHHHS